MRASFSHAIIDYHAFAEQAGGAEVAERAGQLTAVLRQRQRQLILGVDRLDYTKGIPHRRRAFRTGRTCVPWLE